MVDVLRPSQASKKKEKEKNRFDELSSKDLGKRVRSAGLSLPTAALLNTVSLQLQVQIHTSLEGKKIILRT